MLAQVGCAFGTCPARTTIEEFDEAVWLPVFKLTREHLGFFCPRHVAEVRAGEHDERYLLTRAGPDELIIDKLPLEPEAATPADPSVEGPSPR